MKHEKPRVACPETKEQVMDKLIRSWNALLYLQNELEELVNRVKVRIQHFEHTHEGAIPARTGVDATDDMDTRGNR